MDTEIQRIGEEATNMRMGKGAWKGLGESEREEREWNSDVTIF